MNPEGIPADFAGRPGVALVVGGNGGLGVPIARMLAERGATVVVTYRREAPDHAAAYRLDAGDLASVSEVIDRVADEGGGIHTVVHAAGPHVPMVHLSRVEPAAMAAQLAADAAGCFAVAHAALQHLRETSGSLVVVTTAATTRFPRRDGLSSVPKGAVEAMVRALAVEEGRFGVRVNAVGPGMITDGMAERLMASGDLSDSDLDVTRANIPMRRFGSAADIAEAVCFLASDRAGFVSGQKLDVDGGYGA